MTRKPTGYVIYSGPSLIDGAPIVAIATIASNNRKTGPMVQTWILRADVDPRDASRTGADYSICGGCPSRGEANLEKATGLADNRICYVVIAQAPLGVWKAYRRGRYPVVSGHTAIAAVGAGRLVRIGSYGDGAAVPSYVWGSLISAASGHTAYTHQSGIASADVRRDLYMISTDSEAESRAAWDAGARTFRVVSKVSDVIQGKEILCPASKEAGERTTCAGCKLCGGTSVRAKSVAIVAHGNGAASRKP